MHLKELLLMFFFVHGLRNLLAACQVNKPTVQKTVHHSELFQPRPLNFVLVVIGVAPCRCEHVLNLTDLLPYNIHPLLFVIQVNLQEGTMKNPQRFKSSEQGVGRVPWLRAALVSAFGDPISNPVQLLHTSSGIPTVSATVPDVLPKIPPPPICSKFGKHQICSNGRHGNRKA